MEKALISPFDGGNNIRGKLRRAASEVIFNALEEKGQTIKKETYSGMTSGAVSAQPKTDKLLLSESKAANQHIFFGLFGGGPDCCLLLIRPIRYYLSSNPLLTTTLCRFGLMKWRLIISHLEI